MGILIVNEINLTDFNAWAGGRDNLDSLAAYDLIEQAEDYINDIFDRALTDTELNDILWFDEYIDEIINEAYEIKQAKNESED